MNASLGRGMAGKVLLCLILAALFPAIPPISPAQEDLDLSKQGQLVREMRYAIEHDPATVDSLAERIFKSTLAEDISANPDPNQRLEDIKKWAAGHPDQAAHVAVGLARDDAEGSTAFESALKTGLKEGEARFEGNPNIGKTILGSLRQSGKDAKAVKDNENMKEEEKRELLKNVFEGEGGMSGKILGFGPEEGRKPAGSVQAMAGYYDRLAAGNLTGYSPQLLALQSSLNSRRVPGAPRLAETGRLDYETLNYPSYQMRYDLGNLETRLRYERNYALARLLGREKSLKPEDLADEAAGRKLEAEAAGKARLDPRFAKRLKTLGRIRAALADFEAAAAQSRDPSRITRGLLLALGSKQKEAARWITVASLEEELAMIEAEEGFCSAELLRAIDACPAADDAKAAYKRRGEDLKRKLAAIKANDLAAVDALEGAGWEAAVERVSGLLAQNAGLRKNLSRSIRDYAETPFRLAAAWRPRPRWRAMLDGLIRRFLPSSGYAVRLAKAEAELGVFKDAFAKIAAGELDAAHQVLRSIP